MLRQVRRGPAGSSPVGGGGGGGGGGDGGMHNRIGGGAGGAGGGAGDPAHASPTAAAAAPAAAVALAWAGERDAAWYAPVGTVAFMLAAIVRAVGAVAGPVAPDCDEVFNFWEPTHYVMYGRGLQTWEYRCASARVLFCSVLRGRLRSWPPARGGHLSSVCVRSRLASLSCPVHSIDPLRLQSGVCTAVVRIHGAACRRGPGRAGAVDAQGVRAPRRDARQVTLRARVCVWGGGGAPGRPQLQVFFLLRVALGLASAATEVYAYKGVQRRFGALVGALTFWLLVCSAGMFHAAPGARGCAFACRMCCIRHVHFPYALVCSAGVLAAAPVCVNSGIREYILYLYLYLCACR